MAISVVIWTCTVLLFELRVYVKVRQDYLTSAAHRLRASATTVLINSIPSPWLTEDALKNLFDVYPGGVKNIWINRDLSELLEKISKRDQIHLRLEAEETALIQAAKKEQQRKTNISSKSLVIATKKQGATCELNGDGNIHLAAAVSEPKSHRPWSSNATSHNIVKAIEKAGDCVDGVMGRTNGFVQLQSASNRVQDLSHPYHDISIPTQTTPSLWHGNTNRILSEPCANKVVAWWQFWKPPLGSYSSPVPQYRSQSHVSKRSLWWQLWSRLWSLRKKEVHSYPEPFSSTYEETERDAVWRIYLSQKKRKSHYLPPFGIKWLPGIPLVSRKVDTIWWCRRELARLNMEIEMDQRSSERFPLMNSAFIQFQNQTAAHMACQAEAYHIPRYMAPRMIEISPQDIIWSNLSLTWWKEWIRATIVTCTMCLMIILWAIPMAWTAVLGQFDSIIQNGQWLLFIQENSSFGYAFRAISGVIPTAILTILLFVVPPVLDTLAEFKGVKTGSQKTEFIQTFYFVFLFIQLFLVVSITSFLTTSLDQLIKNVQKLQGNDILDILATNIPKASNYFFSYMILQGLSVSSGTLFQGGTIALWYIIAPALDRTARSKWSRNVKLNQIRWGALFPVYTNLACIGLIYCIIAPIISIFVVITFSVFWFTQRYTILYVTQLNHDTGGILYPRAINQTFTGLYMMELCVAGLFFIVEDSHGTKACIGHGMLMLLVLFMTALYQYLLNASFRPLFRHLPVTLEDEAVIREEAFERAERVKTDFQDSGPEGKWSQRHENRQVNRDDCVTREIEQQDDAELMSDALYGAVKTEIQDLSPAERATLVNNAFYHVALRAPRPTVWIPHDNLGVSDDQIRQTKNFSSYISISNDGALLDGRAQVVYGKAPPDISRVDLMKL